MGNLIKAIAEYLNAAWHDWRVNENIDEFEHQQRYAQWHLEHWVLQRSSAAVRLHASLAKLENAWADLRAKIRGVRHG